MTLSDAQAWVVIIVGVSGALTAAVVGIINAIKTQRVENKVDTVHELTNSRLSRIEGELTATRNELAAALKEVAQAEHARATLAREAAQTLAHPPGGIIMPEG